MQPVRLSIIYYSATGTIYQLASAMAQAAEEAGAEVRLRKVRELAPATAIDRNPAWREHLEATSHIPEATYADLEWSDAYIFGTPTRFGNVAAPLKQFLDTTGSLWAQGKLSNRAASGFTSAGNDHGGQESTLLALYNMFYHWGAFIVPPGYTDPLTFAAGGNPYGVSVTANGSIPEAIFSAARYQARRMVRISRWLAAGHEAVEHDQQATLVLA